MANAAQRVIRWIYNPIFVQYNQQKLSSAIWVSLFPEPFDTEPDEIQHTCPSLEVPKDGSFMPFSLKKEKKRRNVKSITDVIRSVISRWLCWWPSYSTKKIDNPPCLYRVFEREENHSLWLASLIDCAIQRWLLRDLIVESQTGDAWRTNYLTQTFDSPDIEMPNDCV